MAAIRATSSTPAAAARVSTASMTDARRSGAVMPGTGTVLSSKVMVRRMPGRRRAPSGSDPVGWSRAAAIGFAGVHGRQRVGRVDDAGADREPLQPEGVAGGDQDRWGPVVDVEDESGADHLACSCR